MLELLSVEVHVTQVKDRGLKLISWSVLLQKTISSISMKLFSFKSVGSFGYVSQKSL